MRQVLDKMLELETYNEVVALLRGIITDQDEINRRTKERQKEKLKGLFRELMRSREWLRRCEARTSQGLNSPSAAWSNHETELGHLPLSVPVISSDRRSCRQQKETPSRQLPPTATEKPARRCPLKNRAAKPAVPRATDELSVDQARLADRYKRLEEVVGRLAELSAKRPAPGQAAPRSDRPKPRAGHQRPLRIDRQAAAGRTTLGRRRPIKPNCKRSSMACSRCF